MGFYDEIDRQAEANPLNAQLDEAIERYEEEFGEAPMIPMEISFSRERLIDAINEAVENGIAGIFKS